MTANQQGHINSLKAGPGHVPAIVFAKLRDLGFVEKVEGGPSAGRGKAYCKLTPAGSLQVTA